uniref:NADH-plastoquinone oxidoreductase subunit 5 n=1 Tax=Diplopterygium chinense TaxID=397680 RepID=UPI0020287461|nr:NADH-plastoquinone oxidoreductase subunit 5 [Diplopterygium chinense]QYC93008.1 NADH-plastoquinone oxidoreductase subunit 5 [Diplopterygium chinense]
MELLYKYSWIVPSCPFVTSGSIGLLLFLFPKSTRSLRRICSTLSILSLAVAMSVSLIPFWQQVNRHSTYEYSWSRILNDDISLKMGFSVDPLTPIVSVLVTTVGISVMIHSDSYMRHDQGYVRFPVYLSLFTASMLGLVFSPNSIQIYVFWELVGMCSYLLIGFWFVRPSAANACQKAFVTNRIGDFGFLLGILGTYWITGSFEIRESCDRLSELTDKGSIGYLLANACALSPFLGPAAKSAQSPLHIWLPDAMEGPTPISALIHAATMVAAGIFFVARMLKLFETLPLSMNVISYVGAITALLGATIALAQRDLKKGLAHSTMSQLGYMMLALGIGAYRSALFHLVTHAYSKALLFLGSGSVIHSMEKVVGYSPNKSQNMFLMGGLRKYMPITGTTFLLGTLSLCGIPPLACFWSKDEIISESWLHSPLLGCIASLTAGLTAFYMSRIYILTFEGSFRASSGSPQSSTLSSRSDNFIWGNTKMAVMGQEITDTYSLIKKEEQILPTIDSSEEFLVRREEINTGPDIYYSSKSLYPKESDTLMLLPLILLSIPTLLIGFVGVRKDTGLDSLSEWLIPLISLSEDTKNSNSENFLRFLIDSISSVSLSLVGVFISCIIYGPIDFYRRDSYKNKGINSLLEKLEIFFGSVSLAIQNWSYNRGYIDYLYDIFFVRGTLLLSKLTSLLEGWIIDGIINGTGTSTLLGGEGARLGEGGRISSYLFGLMIGITPLLTVFAFPASQEFLFQDITYTSMKENPVTILLRFSEKGE